FAATAYRHDRRHQKCSVLLPATSFHIPEATAADGNHLERIRESEVVTLDFSGSRGQLSQPTLPAYKRPGPRRGRSMPRRYFPPKHCKDVRPAEMKCVDKITPARDSRHSQLSHLMKELSRNS